MKRNLEIAVQWEDVVHELFGMCVDLFVSRPKAPTSLQKRQQL